MLFAMLSRQMLTTVKLMEQGFQILENPCTSEDFSV